MASSVIEKFFSVEGKAVLITGASSGLGRAIAFLLAEAGANVVLAARREDRLQVMVDEITKLKKGKVAYVVMDVAGNEASIEAAVADAWSKFGRIDVLFNNAGTSIGGVSAVDHTVDNYETVFGVNVRGCWLVARAVAKRMSADRKGGSIINTSSCVDQMVLSGASLYSATKSAVTMVTKHMARELGPLGVRVNAINPGVFDTEMASGILDEKAAEHFKKLPLGRWGNADKDLFGPFLLLASDAGAYITGSTLSVDGGISLIDFNLTE